MLFFTLISNCFLCFSKDSSEYQQRRGIIEVETVLFLSCVLFRGPLRNSTGGLQNDRATASGPFGYGGDAHLIQILVFDALKKVNRPQE